MAIIVEIGDIHDFSDAAYLISYAAMEPLVHQSGSTTLRICQYPNTDLGTCAKRCIKRFFTVCKYCPTFNAYYTKKSNQGKTHRCAQGHCVRKLSRVIYKLLANNTAFDENLVK